MFENLKKGWKLNKNWIQVLLGVWLLIWLGVYYKFTNGIGITAAIASIFLALSLIPSNLTKIFQFNPIQFLARNRRNTGIISGFLFLTHVFLGASKYLTIPLDKLPNISFIFGMLANYIFIILLLTSPFFVKKFLKKKWNWIHSLIWTALPLILAHSILTTKYIENSFSKVGILIILPLFLFAVFKIFLPKQDKSDSIRDLGFLFVGIVITGLLFVGNISAIKDIYKNGETINSNNTGKSGISNDLKLFNKSEIGLHNSKNDCWAIYEKKVYNLTDYVNNHPGGKSIVKSCGKDLGFLESGHDGPPPSSPQFQTILNPRLIGTVSN